MRGLREGDVSRVAGSPSDGTAWEGKDGQVELEQRSHGRGGFPSSKMIPTFLTCLRHKCTLIAVRVPALPGQPSTGHSLVPPLVGNSIRLVFGTPPPPMAASVQLHLSALAFPCCTIQWASSDPASIPFPQYPHLTRSISPSPVILRPYTNSDWFPAVGHGLHVMLTVLPTFV